MSDVSGAFDEYISKKCDEILLNDKTYCEENNKIVEMEAVFKATLTLEQKKAYSAIEYASLSNAAHGMRLICINLLADKAV